MKKSFIFVVTGVMSIAALAFIGGATLGEIVYAEPTLPTLQGRGQAQSRGQTSPTQTDPGTTLSDTSGQGGTTGSTGSGSSSGSGGSAASQALEGVNSVSTGEDPNLSKSIQTIINVLFFVIGLLAVIVIIIGGIMYVLSAGDQAKTTKAKDTILYAVIGLVVALLAFAIVTFILNSLGA